MLFLCDCFKFQFAQPACVSNTWAECRQEGLALKHLNNLPGNRLEEVEHLVRQGYKLQELAEALQPPELWVILREGEKQDTRFKDNNK